MTLQVRITQERWQLNEAFEIAGQVMTDLPLLLLELIDENGNMGRAEAAGIDYDGETPESMSDQLNSILPKLRSTTTPIDVQAWLPRGGARNALDCALWDLQAKRCGKPAWFSAGLEPMRPVTTACTIGLGNIADIRRHARRLSAAPMIKIKVDGVRHVKAIRAVREEAPMARLVIDANQSWGAVLIQKLLPELLDLGVEFIEQPVPRGSDAQLDGLNSPIPIVADESCTDRRSLPFLVNRYQGVNIKLDKTGGLTEALALAHEARLLGFDIMVGNMCGTSLGMASAFLVAQKARWVDLDGPLLQQKDRPYAMQYLQGVVEPPSSQLWG
jgi:L-alanine-DL-glutamate epimerase-like enolase superfamily enzyme